MSNQLLQYATKENVKAFSQEFDKEVSQRILAKIEDRKRSISRTLFNNQLDEIAGPLPDMGIWALKPGDKVRPNFLNPKNTARLRPMSGSTSYLGSNNPPSVFKAYKNKEVYTIDYPEKPLDGNEVFSLNENYIVKDIVSRSEDDEFGIFIPEPPFESNFGSTIIRNHQKLMIIQAENYDNNLYLARINDFYKVG